MAASRASPARGFASGTSTSGTTCAGKIIAEYPQLTLADVYAALAYYLDHREEIQRQAKEDEEYVAKMKREQGVTKFDLLKKRLGLDDVVSSG